MKTKTKIILAGVLVLVVVLGWGIASLVECTDINDIMNRAINQEVNEDTEARVQRIDGKLQKVGFWKYLFVPKLGKYNELKAENDRYIQQYADDLSAQIAALEPCTSIASKDDYDALDRMLSNMEVDQESAFGQRVLEQVDNYEDFESYVERFEALVETYKYDCSACHGKGRVSCGSCNGRGVKGVTWYEFGDWGETSYSNYDCTACDGRGKKDCGVCDGGVVYHFYDMSEVEEVPAEVVETTEYDVPVEVPAVTEYDMKDILSSFFAFEEDGSARHTYLMEHREELRALTEQELEEILSRDGVGLLEVDVTGGNTDQRFYRVTEYDNGVGQMYNEFTIVAQGNGEAAPNPDAKIVEIANQDGILKEGLSMAFQLREALPGYYFAYRYLAGSVFDAPMYLYVLCDDTGTPLYPLEY